jgi:hypothetical protein
VRVRAFVHANVRACVRACACVHARARVSGPGWGLPCAGREPRCDSLQSLGSICRPTRVRPRGCLLAAATSRSFCAPVISRFIRYPLPWGRRYERQVGNLTRAEMRPTANRVVLMLLWGLGDGVWARRGAQRPVPSGPEDGHVDQALVRWCRPAQAGRGVCVDSWRVRLLLWRLRHLRSGRAPACIRGSLYSADVVQTSVSRLPDPSRFWTGQGGNSGAG